MKIKKFNGFSLMEMMVVLLIVAIVMAAAAPMVSRRMLRTAAGTGGECLWAEEDSGFIYPENTNNVVVIGRDNLPNGSESLAKGSLQIFNSEDNPTPHICLWDGGDLSGASIYYNADSNSIGFGSSDAITDNSVLLGIGAKMEGAAATVVGTNSQAGESGIAIGSEVVASENAVAIGTTTGEDNACDAGNNAVAVGASSIAHDSAVSAGYLSNSSMYGVAVGYRSKAGTVSDTSPKYYGVAIGYGAEATGVNSIAIGSGTLGTTSGTIGNKTQSLADYSIAIGANARVPDADYTNSVAIGYGAAATAPNQIVLGGVNHTVVIPGTLVVEGNIYKKDGSNYNKLFSGTNNFLYYSVETSYTSDRRLKDVGEVFKGGLEELKKLDLYNYTFKNDKNKTPHVGVMAQDLQKIFPDAVIKGEDGFLKIRMEDMFYAVINAVKELDSKITALAAQVQENLDLTARLQARIDSQDKEIAELKQQNAEFEKRLAKLEKSKKVKE